MNALALAFAMDTKVGFAGAFASAVQFAGLWEIQSDFLVFKKSISHREFVLIIKLFLTYHVVHSKPYRSLVCVFVSLCQLNFFNY